MSLLLLFPNDVTATAGWTVVSCPGATWGIAGCSALDTWGDWESTTWGAIESTGFTWDQMAGFTFVTTTCSTTTWTATTC